MKKILSTTTLLVFIFTANIVTAQQQPVPQLADGVKIYEKAVQKMLLNSKGELAPGDKAKEVYGFKRNIFNMYIETKINMPTFSTSTAVKIYSLTDYKTNQKTKTRIEASGTSYTPVVNNTEKDAILIRSMDKYVKGNHLETYIATDVDQEKVYNVWKVNIVTDAFKTILSNKNVPKNISNNIINKIISKKYLKLTHNEINKGLLELMGLKSSTQSTTTPIQSIVKETNRLNTEYVKALSVKQYNGVVDYDDVEMLNKNEKLVTTTPLHSLVLKVDPDQLTKYIIENKKIDKYTFGLLDNGANPADVATAVRNLYQNIEVLVWVDANTYEIKAFEIPAYEITYTIGEIRLSVVVSLDSVEGLTRSTGYMDPLPKRFITPKEIRNMFLKY